MEAERIKYLKDTNVHHLFELLASRVLSQRPKDVYSFMRSQIDEIEAAEKRTADNKHNPNEIPRSRPASAASAAPPVESPAAAGPAPSALQTGTTKLTLAVFGLDGAGKTALIGAIGGTPNKHTQPTVGFSPTFFETDTSDVCMFDLGGGGSFRSVWKHYYHDVHGVVFVVDGADHSRFPEAAAALKELINHPYMLDKPLLLFVNKRDKPGFVGADGIAAALGESVIAAASRNGRPFKILPIMAVNENIEDETNLDEGLEWLLETIQHHFDRLSSLVTQHSAEVKEAKKKALEEQAARVAAAKAAEEE